MLSLNTPHSICRFGIARRDITPPVGIYHRMWGAARHDRCTGVHRPLIASAMVFEPYANGRGKQIVVALDHCLLFDPEIQQIKSRITQVSSVALDEIILTFSHTHAAGLMDPRRADMPGGDLIAPYLEDLSTKIASAVDESLSHTQRVTVIYATGRCSLAANRDFWDEKNNLFVCGFNPLAAADDTVVVAQVISQTEQPVATIINYACHPTTLAWDNQLISPDFPGATRELVEQVTGSPCVFLQGASGDLGPRVGFVGDTAAADRNGRQLGYAALAALEAAPPPKTRFQYQGPVISGATVGCWRDEPLSEEELDSKHCWRLNRWEINLPYRSGLPNVEETQHQYDHWERQEQHARQAGDQAKAEDARAMVERMRRWLTRLSTLPSGDHFPYPVSAWRLGDAIWLAVEGEPYNLLQRELRRRFPTTPIIVTVLANGSRAWYLPTQETYGTGIYQESTANLESGCLEQLIHSIGDEIELLLE